MNSPPIPVKKYLAKYGSGKWKLEFHSRKYFNNILVVPALQEYENIRNLLESLAENDKKCFSETLVIFVVNNLPSTNGEAKEDNRKSLEFIREIISKKIVDNLAGKIINSGLNVALVDASAENLELPEKEGGVGLARKIGMDLALSKFDYSNNAKKILICLDADCTVDTNYLTSIIQTFEQQDAHAAYVQYEHLLPENDKDKLAIICYEIFLRYYLLGLKYAGSPFAFPTIGSTMICDYESYIRIGGMNKKKAAEDFYFMEKLAKITNIKKIDSTKVYPASRGSWRVPFGTGQRVNRFNACTHDEYLLYNPESFEVLKKWLAVFYSPGICSADEYLNKTKEISISLQAFLVHNSFKDNWEKIIRNSKTDEQKEKQKTIWFDGFTTLKLIHFLRDNELPQVNMFDALDEMFVRFDQKFFGTNNNSLPSIEIQVEYLRKLRELT